MEQRLKLPVGIDDFEKIRRNEFYYVDKTKLIEQLLQNWGEVSLFTRPRRFGKTLNMSMLKCFFEIGTDHALFDGLYISGNKELCDTYMGKYPVIFLLVQLFPEQSIAVVGTPVQFTAKTALQRLQSHILLVIQQLQL